MKPGLRTQQRNYKDVKGLSWSEGAEWNEVKVDWWTAIPVVLAFIMSAVALGFGIAGFVIGKELQPAVANNTHNISVIDGGHAELATGLAAANLKLAPAPHVSTCTSKASAVHHVFGPDITTTMYVSDSVPTADTAPVTTALSAYVATTDATMKCAFSVVGSTDLPAWAHADDYHIKQTAAQLTGCTVLLGSKSAYAAATPDATDGHYLTISGTIVSGTEKSTKVFQYSAQSAGKTLAATGTGSKVYTIEPSENTEGSMQFKKSGITTTGVYTMASYCDADTGKRLACITFTIAAGKQTTICGAPTA